MDVTPDELLTLPPCKIDELATKSKNFNDFMLKKKQTIDDAIKNKTIKINTSPLKLRNNPTYLVDLDSEGAESNDLPSQKTPDHSYHFKETSLQSSSTPLKSANVQKKQKNVDQSQFLVVGQKLTNGIESTPIFKSTGKCVVCFTQVNETNSIQTNVNTQSFTEFGFILKLILGLSKCELESNLCCTSCSSRVMHTFNDWLDINVLALLKDDVKSYKHRICDDCKFSLPTLESFTDHLFSHIITGKPLKTKLVFKVNKDALKLQPSIEKTKSPKAIRVLNTKSQNIQKPRINVPFSKKPATLQRKKVNVITPSPPKPKLTNSTLIPNILRRVPPFKQVDSNVDSDVVIIGEKQFTVGRTITRLPDKQKKIVVSKVSKNSNVVFANKVIRVAQLLPKSNTFKDITLESGTNIKISSNSIVPNNVTASEDGVIPNQDKVTLGEVVPVVNSDNVMGETSNTEIVKISKESQVFNSEDALKSDNVLEKTAENLNTENVMISEETAVSEDLSNSRNVMEIEGAETSNPENVAISDKIAGLDSDIVMEGDEEKTLDQDVTIGNGIPNADAMLNSKYSTVDNEELSNNVMDVDEFQTLNSEDHISNSVNDMTSVQNVSDSNIVLESEQLSDINIVSKETVLVEENILAEDIITRDGECNKSAEEVPLPS